MIDRKDLYGVDFYKTKDFVGKLVPFYGSHAGMRFKIELIKGDEETGTTDIFKAWIFPEPLGFDATSDDLKESRDFEFTNAGLDSICEWLNENYDRRIDYWKSFIS